MVSAESIAKGLDIILKMEAVPWLAVEYEKIYAGEGKPGELYDEADVAELNRLGWRWNDLHETWEHNA